MRATILLAAALAISPTLTAHHSFASVFDEKATVHVSGTITKVEWANPHAWFYVDVKDAAGKVVNWAFETSPPNMLVRNGWKKDTLKQGDAVTVDGFRSKDGSSMASARTITLPDGKKVFSGQADASGRPVQ